MARDLVGMVEVHHLFEDPLVDVGVHPMAHVHDSISHGPDMAPLVYTKGSDGRSAGLGQQADDGVSHGGAADATN